MGVFLLKKVENRWCFFVKKWNMGVFCKKSGPSLNGGCIMYSISIFYLAYYFLGCVRTQRTPPAHTGLLCNVVSRFFRSIKIIDILNRSTAEVPVMVIHYTRTFSDDNQVLDNYFLYS